MNSFYKAEVVPFKMEKHPNADSLSIVKVFGGYTYVARTEDWIGVEKAAFIPSDNLVDVTRPEFAWLKEKEGQTQYRIKAQKLRGVWSEGLMVRVPDSFNIGDDVTEYLGVVHYNPPEQEETPSNDMDKSPEGIKCPGKYDLESLKKYHYLIGEGTPVVLQEKVDGQNVLMVFVNGNFHVKSRNYWKKEFTDTSHLTVEYFLSKGKTQEEAETIVKNIASRSKRNEMWQILRDDENIQKFLMDNPGYFLFGERFGDVNRIKYGLSSKNSFVAFDIWKEGEFFPPEKTLELCLKYNVAHVPIIDSGPFNKDKAIELAEGQTLIKDAKPGTIREGLVVKPLVPAHDYNVGRIAFKVHSPSFLNIKTKGV